MSTHRIVIIDSGRGGRFFAERITTLFPGIELSCETDEANVPYGEKSPQELLILGQSLLQRALAHNPELIIIACHTLCSWCFEELQAETSVPLWSVNDVLLEEIQGLPEISSLEIWGTTSTITSNWFQRQVTRHRPDISLQLRACPGLASAIEEENAELIQQLLQEYLSKESARTLALACTHYPVISDQIRQRFAGTIIDPQTRLKARMFEFTAPSQE